MYAILSTLLQYLAFSAFNVLTIVLLLAGYLFARYCWELIPEGDNNSKAVLITGCDSGFGRAFSLKCARKGFTVFAGCLSEQARFHGRESLCDEAALLPLHAIPLDITKDESVAVARTIVEQKLGLWAVVNNAGIFSCYGPAEWCSADEYKLSFEVNFLGAVRVTNAFLDLVKRCRGRVISVSSVAGRVAMASTAPYSAAKFGLEAWNDVIRRELRQFGVSVHLIEPGIVKATNLLDKQAHQDRADSVWRKMPAQLREDYGEEYKQKIVAGWNAAMDRQASTTMNDVVNAYYHALTAKYPRLRYQGGWDAITYWSPASYMPTPLQDAFLSRGKKGLVPAIMKRGGYTEKKRD